MKIALHVVHEVRVVLIAVIMHNYARMHVCVFVCIFVHSCECVCVCVCVCVCARARGRARACL